MSQRTGRPKAENPKTADLKVRLDEAAHNELLDFCQRNDLTKAEAVRKGIGMVLEKNEK